ncbi:MAG: KdsC family phosphatase [Kiloniellales bacterium]
MTTLSAEALDAIVFDFDGVLTDNRVVVFQDGREAVFCNRGDGLAFDYLRRVEMPAYILSRETNPVVAARAEKLGVPVYAGVKDKAEGLERLCAERGHAPARILYVANDVIDLPVMRRVGFAAAVADAHPAVREAASMVLETRGGAGVAREIVESVVAFAAPFDAEVLRR